MSPRTFTTLGTATSRSLASRYKGYKRYKTDNENKNVADVADVALRAGKESEKPCQACVGTPDWLSGKGCPHCKPENYGLPPKVKPQKESCV